jgi:hypothetical protein
MGRLRPVPAKGDAVPTITLPAPDTTGGMPLMDALSKRQSAREFAATELPLLLLSNLLWAANGINRADGHHTAPSAMNAQEIDIYVALPAGAYFYDPAAHALQLTAGSDVRRVTGYQDFVDQAPLDLVYVADHGRMTLIPVANRDSFASAAAGAITQNVYLFAAGNGPPSSAPGSIARRSRMRSDWATTSRCCCHRRWDSPRAELVARLSSIGFERLPGVWGLAESLALETSAFGAQHR